MRYIACAVILATCFVGGAGAQGTVSLARKARWEAQHGGIRSTRYGDATQRMKTLSRQLVVRRFARAGGDAVRWALCVVERESGFNPGAVNSTAIAPDVPVAGAGHASGLPQIVVYYHRWVDRWKLLHDPAYAVAAMYRLSNGGLVRGPWQGGGYSC